jgi:lysophospholipase L1-like esterase
LAAGVFFWMLCLLFSQLAVAAAPEIVVDPSTRSLVAPEGTRYQWFLNDAPLPDGQQQALKVSQSGTYSVLVTDGAGMVTRQTAQIAVSPKTIRRIYLIGDSTVMTYASSAYPQAGWGQVLPGFFDGSQTQFLNRAIGGRSSRSFHQEGRWTTIRNGLQAGDFVFIQFGHNDRDFTQSARYADTATYKSYLRIYVNETRSMGAFPVLITPMVLNAWRNGLLRNVFTESGNDYRGAMVDVATKLNVPLIDLNLRSHALLQPLGSTYLTRFVYLGLQPGEYGNFPSGISDFTHFQEMGAIDMAKLIVAGMQALSADPNVSDLITLLRPTYQVAVSTNNIAAASLITRSNSYPAGLTITLKTVPNAGFTFSRWVDGNGQTVSTTPRFSFVMSTASAQYQAIFATTVTAVTPANQEDAEVSVAPNPAGGPFQLHAKGAFTYTITDPLGRVVSSGQGVETAAVGAGLPAGSYLIRLSQDGITRTLKAIKE